MIKPCYEDAICRDITKKGEANEKGGKVQRGLAMKLSSDRK